jgi:hypothetical protein
MKKLDTILRDDRETISNLALTFGFCNVKILRPFSEDFKTGTLYLVVEKKKQEEQYPAALEAMLKDKLNSKLEIMISNNIKKVYKEEILSNCADISNQAEINSLFENINEIELEEFEDVEDILFMEAKELGEKIIQKKKSKNVNLQEGFNREVSNISMVPARSPAPLSEDNDNLITVSLEEKSSDSASFATPMNEDSMKTPPSSKRAGVDVNTLLNNNNKKQRRSFMGSKSTEKKLPARMQSLWSMLLVELNKNPEYTPEIRRALDDIGAENSPRLE